MRDLLIQPKNGFQEGGNLHAPCSHLQSPRTWVSSGGSCIKMYITGQLILLQVAVRLEGTMSGGVSAEMMLG